MRVGVKGHYAILALADVVAQGGEKPARLIEISTRQNLPLPYLEQLFSQLRRKGLVKSIRGRAGGYLLRAKPEEMNIADILRAIEEPIAATRCKGHKDTPCQGGMSRCLAHNLWEGLEHQLLLYLSSVTLADVCKSQLSPSIPFPYKV